MCTHPFKLNLFSAFTEIFIPKHSLNWDSDQYCKLKEINLENQICINNFVMYIFAMNPSWIRCKKKQNKKTPQTHKHMIN